jgi:hypothetical protein
VPSHAIGNNQTPCHAILNKRTPLLPIAGIFIDPMHVQLKAAGIFIDLMACGCGLNVWRGLNVRRSKAQNKINI